MSSMISVSPLPASFLDMLRQWPEPVQARFVDIRAIILAAAQDLGPVAESLKWGQPAWRPTIPRQGSTLRLSWTPKFPDQLGFFVNCQTTLAATMRDIYPDSFEYEGNRGLWLAITTPLPTSAIDHLARMTFTYHRTK